MNDIKITIFHTGWVCVSPYLPFGDNCSVFKAAGIGVKKSERMWLPVSAYLIEYKNSKILVDCGWDRAISPNGVFDKKAQIKSLGSYFLYLTNQGKIEKGAAIDEQLAKIGIQPKDLDCVVLTHLDCDHANGLNLVKDAKRIIVAKDEMLCAQKKSPMNKIRYQKKWWENCTLELFDFNQTDGPFNKSYDLFGDGCITLINIPGHCDGLCAVKIKNSDGKYVLLFSDGGYGTKSWQDMITSGISMDKKAQKKSLEWIREQSLDENCVESLANHDPDIKPHTIVI